MLFVAQYLSALALHDIQESLDDASLLKPEVQLALKLTLTINTIILNSFITFCIFLPSFEKGLIRVLKWVVKLPSVQREKEQVGLIV